MSENNSVVSGIKRKMRKGTASCIECRRRKIRCTFIRGDSRCSNCLARGTPCIDQRDADGNDVPPEDSNTSLRERVACLERQLSDVVQSLKGDIRRRSFQDRMDTPSGSELGPDIDTEPQSSLKSISDDVSHAWQVERVEGDIYCRIAIPERRALEVCRQLRASLPDFDALIALLQSPGSWWTAHQERMATVETASAESLANFASRAYTSKNPGEVGMLVAAYARHTWKGKFHIYGFVDSLVTSDPVYTSTIEGMECLTFLAQCYLDIGQPRRAWLLYRRGIALAHVIGLDRHADKRSREAALWRTLYHGDRLVSIILGLPCGVNDLHYGLDIPRVQQEQGTSQQVFTLRCDVVAGKMMDRCTYKGAPFSVALSNIQDLEQEMDDIAMSVHRDWWLLPSTVPGPGPELDTLRVKLVMQAYYFQVRMHLYLPHLGTSATSTHWQDNLKCMDAARQLLRRSVILSSQVNNYRILECKTGDFIGFIAAAVLQIGLFSLGGTREPQIVGDDQFLIDSMQNLFHTEELARKCQVAAQCCRALELLSKPRDAPESLNGKLVIPYFGTVIRKSNQTPVSNAVRAQTVPDDPLSNTTLNLTGGHPTQNQTTSGMEGISIEGQALPDLLPDDLHWELRNSGTFFTEDFNPMMDPAMMDLAQDWTMFSTLDNSQMM